MKKIKTLDNFKNKNYQNNFNQNENTKESKILNTLEETHLNELLKNLLNIITKRNNYNSNVTNYINYTDLKKKVIDFHSEIENEKLNSENNTNKILEKAAKFLLEYSVNTNHEQFYNQLWSGQSIPSLFGEILAVLTNTSTATFETAPIATTLENILISQFLKEFNFNDGEGQFVPGGSYCNMMAMILARNNFIKNSKYTGLFENKPIAIFTSEDAHYSIDKAANITGIGLQNVIKIKCDIYGSQIVEDLEDKIIKTLELNKKTPFMIIATAGTTVKGAFDNIIEISKIAKKYNLWLHVDGAWGGSLMFSKKNNFLLNGLEFVNSFFIDFHKMLGLPLMCSLFMSRPRGLFEKSFSSGDHSYIFHDHNEEEELNLSSHSLLCGRRNDISKLWFEYLANGPKIWEKNIDKYLELSKLAETIISQNQNLELQSPRIINNICFRFIHPKVKDLNTFNLKIREKLYHENLALVNYAWLNRPDNKKDITIRLIITNVKQNEFSIKMFFENFLNKAFEILKNEN